MANILILLVILIILALAIAKIVIEKKKGVKCIGCPNSGRSKKKKSCHC